MMMGGSGLGASRSPKENKRERERDKYLLPGYELCRVLRVVYHRKRKLGREKRQEKGPTRAAVRNRIVLSV